MKTTNQNPKITWAKVCDVEGVQIQEESFPGTLEEALVAMEKRAASGQFLFGQVLEHDGKVFRNVAGMPAAA